MPAGGGSEGRQASGTAARDAQTRGAGVCQGQCVRVSPVSGLRLARACDQFCTYPLPAPFPQTKAIPMRAPRPCASVGGRQCNDGDVPRTRARFTRATS